MVEGGQAGIVVLQPCSNFGQPRIDYPLKLVVGNHSSLRKECHSESICCQASVGMNSWCALSVFLLVKCEVFQVLLKLKTHHGTI